MNIDISPTAIQEVCRRHHVQRLSLFGSVVRDDFRPESDVDVLVEFEPGAHISLLDMVDLQLELENLFERKVDLGTPTSLSKYIRARVLRSAQVIYERT